MIHGELPKVGLHLVEIHVYHGRQKLTNNLGRIVARIGRTAIVKYHKNQILADETGWHSISTAYRNEGGSLLNSGI